MLQTHCQFKCITIDIGQTLLQKILPKSGDDISIKFFWEKNIEIDINSSIQIDISIRDRFENVLFYLSSEISGEVDITKNSDSCECYIERLPLLPGTYNVNYLLKVNNDTSDWLQNAFELEVESGSFYNTGKLPPNEYGGTLLKYIFK